MQRQYLSFSTPTGEYGGRSVMLWVISLWKGEMREAGGREQSKKREREKTSGSGQLQRDRGGAKEGQRRRMGWSLHLFLLISKMSWISFSVRSSVGNMLWERKEIHGASVNGAPTSVTMAI